MMGYARACNQYFDARQPWSTRTNNPAQCAATIATCIDALHYLAIMASPYMPGASGRIFKMLGLPAERIVWEPPHPPEAGRTLGTAEILFAPLKGQTLG